jgi:hypothetical protein
LDGVAALGFLLPDLDDYLGLDDIEFGMLIIYKMEGIISLNITSITKQPIK